MNSASMVSKVSRRDLQSLLCQNDIIVFGIVSDLADLGIRHGCFEGRNDLFQREICPCTMTDRDVISFAFLDRQRDADDIRSHLLRGGGFGIKGNNLCFVELFYKVRQLFSVCQRP